MLREFDKYRRIDGIIDLDRLPEVTTLESPEKIKYSFIYDGEAYLFKKDHYSGEALIEILNELIMNSLELDNAQYDVATYKGMTGCLTKSFIKQGSVFQTGNYFLKQYNPDSDNDIFDYAVALLNAGLPIELVKIKIQKMLKNHIVDIFTFQTDRFSDNLGFLITGEEIEVAPKYDNGYSFLSSIDNNDQQKLVTSGYYRRREMLLEYQFLPHTVLPKYNADNRITEFWRATKKSSMSPMVQGRIRHAQNALNNGINITSDEVYQMIKEQIDMIWPFVERTSSIDFDEFFYTMSDSNMNMPELRKNLIKTIYETTQGMFWNG